MVRLIDAEWIAKAFEEKQLTSQNDVESATWQNAKFAVWDAPTVDAVPVVRCKDCKYAHMTTRGEVKYCDTWFPEDAVYADGDYYCASGERKDGEQDDKVD